MLPKIISRMVAALGALLLCSFSGGLLADTVTGAFAPGTVGASTATTLTLNYSTFAANTVGMQLKVYYNSAAVTPGTFVYSSPPGSSQPQSGATPGVLAGCAGADTFINLNWIDFGAAWPNPASGTLGTFPFTTTAGFNANTSVCWVDDTSGGAPVRNITGNAPLLFAVPPSVSIAASPATLFDSAGNVSTVTVTSTVAATGGGLVVNLTPPAASARYTTTCGASLTIAAGSTTATCTITATPNTIAGDGNVTASVTVAAGAYIITGTNPAVVAVQDDDIPVITATAAPATLTDSAGQVSTVTFSTTLQSAVALPITFTPPAASARYTLSGCTSPVTIPANTSSVVACTITAVANTTMGDGSATATATVLAGAGYTVGTPAAATVTVNNDDFVSVVASTASTIEGGNVAFTITCPGTGPTVAVTYSYSGSYTPLPAGATSNLTCGTPLVITVPTVDDAVVNGDRTITLTITTVAAPGTISPTAASATASVLDNDQPKFIPTLGTWGLMLLGLLLATAAGFGIRRKV